MTTPTRATGTEGNPAPHVHPHDLADEAVAQVRRWLASAARFPVDPAAEQLAAVLKDPHGLEFTVGFVDGVVRPEDLGVAARNLRALAPKAPAFLPWPLKRAVQLGGSLAPVAPGVVVPLARRVLREMVGHLIIDASDARLGPAIAKIRKPGIRLNMNLLGEAILGRDEASRRLEGTRRLLARDDVDYVSIKVSATVAPHNHWAFDEAVGDIVESLAPLYRLASESTRAGRPKFINLDMEEYKDLDLTVAVFTRLLEREEFRDLEAGIVLQAYLPDCLGAMMRLQEWAAERVAGGGAPIKVRVVKGANLPMEQVDAEIHGWPLATWGSKRETDTSYVAVLDYALTPERLANVRIGVAGHNLFDIALAWLLAKARGVETGAAKADANRLVEFEMLLGMASAQAQAVLADVGHLLLYTPVVHPSEFDVAIAYLIRRLEEGASQDNFMSAVFELDTNEVLFEREKKRFLASLEALDKPPFAGGGVPRPRRNQDRRHTNKGLAAHDDGDAPSDSRAFSNTPDTDPDLPGNREWGRAILARAERSTIGAEIVERNTVSSASELDSVIAAALDGGATWHSFTGEERAAILDEMGRSLERHRADLIEAMASECGKTIDQGDPEVSEAVDFAHYYATLARELDTIDGAQFEPSRLTVVTPPWNFPVAIPAGSTLAALAAGSAVVIKPAKQARRSGAVMVQALWEALDAVDIPRRVLQYVQLEDRSLGKQLIAHPDVERVILTGGYETAELFRSFRHDLPLLAETSGKNAIIVTPSADLDLAARDVAQSAFGHAGQKCSAASLVILVGSVAHSKRFRNQLIDAVRSLHVGYPWDPRSQMGPVVEQPGEKLRRGLTQLGEGEHWVLEPRQLDGSGKLWSPGIRAGVRPESEYHLVEYFGPVLGVMTASSLEEAVALANQVDYGLTSGLHSLDPAEIGYWTEHIEAGNLYVNRGITGAIVRRQPFGGWKKSAVGAGAKAGGPNYLIGLGSWADAPVHDGAKKPLEGAAELLEAVQGELAEDDAAWLADALGSDAAVWASEFGVSKDVSGLECERNVFRYRPVPVTVRFDGQTSGHGEAELLRVVGAGLRAGSQIFVSSASALPGNAAAVLERHGVQLVREETPQWLGRARRMQSGRIRLIASPVSPTAAELSEVLGGRPDVAVYRHPVVGSGRVELLPFLHEQAVSVTTHRFGNPNPVMASVRI
ncbi:proline dehydrogenase family protein [Sinomonas humi]|uniref:L-glutamate gamma-semialdehyde dehydrogenase n=1 Tax=Sinomonas humi TaxID=1338436 RepID=A0A0B2AEP4_9MICC|nr:proline dehydrogenase family protein [Sinomonas humi]KHL02029.1 1-pyrroline-5-carboxylate dehydrogenase [Sinomonas humi]